MVVTKQDLTGLRGRMVAQVLRSSPLFLVNTELQLDATLPKMIPTLQLQIFIENRDWPAPPQAPQRPNRDTTGTQDISIEDVDAAYEMYVAPDIFPDERIDTEDSWKIVASSDAQPRRKVRLHRHEINFVFQEETFEMFLSKLQTIAQGTRAGRWSGIDILKLDFFGTHYSSIQEANKVKMLRQLRWCLQASQVQLTGLPDPESHEVSGTITSTRLTGYRILERLAGGMEDLVNGKFHSAIAAFHGAILPHYNLPALWYVGLLNERQIDFLHQEVACTVYLALTKVRNRQLQAFLASGASRRLNLDSLRQALQMARQAYSGVCLSNLHRADAFWECGLMHCWIAAYMTLPNSPLAEQTISPYMSRRYHWKSAVQMMVIALILGHPYSMQIRNVVRHISANLTSWEMYEALDDCAAIQSPAGEQSEWTWAGTREEYEAARVPNSCRQGCKCFKHIREFRSRPNAERTVAVRQCLEALVSIGIALPEDNNILMAQEWERLPALNGRVDRLRMN